jgi:CDP-diacylglycerol--glycerol-3-phosphate 3-phosphatidyltransferase
MQIKIGTEGIPWAMAAGRALLGPVLIAGERCGWNGLMLAWLVVAALLSDIFDGVLARRWKCDTAGVRLFDSMADTVFYACVAIALWIGQPQILRANAGLLAALLALEAMRFGLDFARFGKPASYHSYLAKTWGLVMAIAVVAAFGWGASGLMPVALALGIASDLEGLAMSVVLPVWRKDVKTLRAAWRLRRQMVGTAGKPQRGSWQAAAAGKGPVVRGGLVVGLCLLMAVPAFAVGPGQAEYSGGTVAMARDTVGSFDTTSPTALRFDYKKAGGAAGQVEIEYAKVYGIEPSNGAVHPLGLLPWVAVSLVAHPQRRYLVTVRYADADGTAQIAVFEVARRDQPVIVAIVNARSSHSCGARTYPCPATMERR